MHQRDHRRRALQGPDQGWQELQGQVQLEQRGIHRVRSPLSAEQQGTGSDKEGNAQGMLLPGREISMLAPLVFNRLPFGALPVRQIGQRVAANRVDV